MDQALLVGINSYPSSPLRGCVNDIVDMANFLVSDCGFAKADIRLLTDDRATTAGITERLGWLLNGLRSGDRAVFHYSGHGAQMPSRNPQGDVDKMDDVICPVDFDWSDAHAIRDADFHRFFSNIPDGVRFVWISDSCHSGGLDRDLLNPKFDCRPKCLLPPVDLDWRVQTAKELKIFPTGLKAVADKLNNLAFIAGCKSDQTSADATFNNRANGALTYYLLKELQSSGGKKNPLTKDISEVTTALKAGGYSQTPQLVGSPGLTKKPFLG